MVAAIRGMPSGGRLGLDICQRFAANTGGDFRKLQSMMRDVDGGSELERVFVVHEPPPQRPAVLVAVARMMEGNGISDSEGLTMLKACKQLLPQAIHENYPFAESSLSVAHEVLTNLCLADALEGRALSSHELEITDDTTDVRGLLISQCCNRAFRKDEGGTDMRSSGTKRLRLPSLFSRTSAIQAAVKPMSAFCSSGQHPKIGVRDLYALWALDKQSPSKEQICRESHVSPSELDQIWKSTMF